MTNELFCLSLALLITSGTDVVGFGTNNGCNFDWVGLVTAGHLWLERVVVVDE